MDPCHFQFFYARGLTPKLFLGSGVGEAVQWEICLCPLHVTEQSDFG